MHELDHMLNGAASRRHHQDMIQQAQKERLFRDVRVVRGNHKNVSRIRTVLIAIINCING
jgi:hypothetical protein